MLVGTASKIPSPNALMRSCILSPLSFFFFQCARPLFMTDSLRNALLNSSKVLHVAFTYLFRQMALCPTPLANSFQVDELFLSFCFLLLMIENFPLGCIVWSQDYYFKTSETWSQSRAHRLASPLSPSLSFFYRLIYSSPHNIQQ